MKTNKTQSTFAVAAVAMSVVAVALYYVRGDDTTRSVADNETEQEQQYEYESITSVVDVGQQENASDPPPSSAVFEGEDADSVSDSLVEQVSITPSEVRRVYTPPDYGTDQFRKAEQLAAAYLADTTVSFSRNTILRTDVAALKDFVRQVESSRDGLDSSFDLSPFSDVTCVLTSIRNTTPRFTPGADAVPDRYWIEGSCEAESQSTAATISVNKSRGTINVVLVSSIFGAFQIRRLADTEYSLAFRNDEYEPSEDVSAVF